MKLQVTVRRLFHQVFLLSVLCIIVLISIGTRTDATYAESSAALPGTAELRGVWVHTASIESPEAVAETMERVERGGFNTVFLQINLASYAHYHSILTGRALELRPDFDALAEVIEQAQQRNIEVHAWFIVGRVTSRSSHPVPLLSEHPEWAMMGPDGQTTNWLNYNRPDVRQFINDTILSVVQGYDVAGVHLDYTRYPFDGWKWGYDPYSVEAFEGETGIDLELLRGATLPAYGTFSGNSLGGVETAEVLATFSDGRPAVLLNQYGAGQVILLNWHAEVRDIAASSEILRRSLDYLAGGDGEVYLLRSETNAQEYGYSGFETVLSWLEDVGRSPIEVSETDVASLDVQGALVMPNVYLINGQVAAELATYVEQGGSVIFIDGPTKAIEDANIQAITGMQGRGGHFFQPDMLVAPGEHELIPINASDPGLSLADYQALDAQWRAFRTQGLSKLVQEVYQLTKGEAPEVLVTITVASPQTHLAERYFLDWQAWLEGEYIDLIIPRTYVGVDEPLEPIIVDWQAAIDNSNRITLGLKTFMREGSGFNFKTPAQVLSEIDVARASGSRGVVLFDMEHIEDNTLDALASGPFQDPDDEPTPEPTDTPTPVPSATPPDSNSVSLQFDGPTSVGLGEAVTVNVVAKDIPTPGLYGIQFEIDYDSGLITVDNLQVNSNLSFVVRDTVDNSNGKISLVASQQGQVPGLTGDVTILTFTATAANTAGSVTLTFENEKMSDFQAQGFNVISQDQTISIGEPSSPEPTDEPTPQPTAEPPTPEPTSDPTIEPTPEPTDEPTPQPTAATPTPEPTSEPTPQPTDEPTPEPTNEPTGATLSGQVVLAGRAGNNWAGATVINVDSGQHDITDTVGQFSIAEVRVGSVNAITADAPGYVSARCTGVTVIAPETILDAVHLLSGDINDDDVVDITDATAVGAGFGQTGSDLPADITQDGILDIFDIVLVSVNFGEQGPQIWDCQ